MSWFTLIPFQCSASSATVSLMLCQPCKRVWLNATRTQDLQRSKEHQGQNRTTRHNRASFTWSTWTQSGLALALSPYQCGCGGSRALQFAPLTARLSVSHGFVWCYKWAFSSHVRSSVDCLQFHLAVLIPGLIALSAAWVSWHVPAAVSGHQVWLFHFSMFASALISCLMYS